MDPEPIMGTLGAKQETPWMGNPTLSLALTHSHLAASCSSQTNHWHGFGRWEEAKEHGGNPQRHEENMQNSKPPVT